MAKKFVYKRKGNFEYYNSELGHLPEQKTTGLKLCLVIVYTRKF